MRDEDPYAVLGLPRSASARDIGRAYRKLTRKCHPLVNPGDEAAARHYLELCQAYDILGDERRRAEYDRLGHLDLPGGSGAVTPAGGSEGIFYSSMVREGFIGEILGLKPKLTGGELPQRGEDIRSCIGLSFFEAAKGHEITLEVDRKVTCPSCGGSGAEAGSRRDSCTRCRGTGVDTRAMGPLITERKCPLCRGRGIGIKRSCRTCGKTGLVERRVEVTVRIPAGVMSGSEIRMRGLGHDGEHGGPPGDLVIVTRVEEHPRFTRKGDSVFTSVPVMVWEAALGGPVAINTLDGRSTLDLPPGTQPGQQFRLPHQGILNLKTGRRGDQVVEIGVVIPVPGDEDQKELWKKLAERATAASSTRGAVQGMELSPSGKIK